MFKLYPASAMVFAVCSLLTWTAPTTLAATQNQAPAAASADLPSDQALDALLLAKKWNELAAALSRAKSPASVVRMMDWLQSRLAAGGGSLLGFIYAKDLWDLGEAQKVEDPNKDLRITAGLITLYTYETGFSSFDIGRVAAIAWIFVVIVILVSSPLLLHLFRSAQAER